MTDAEILAQVKTGLNITGNYQDNTLLLYLNDVKNFMLDAGVSNELINSDVSVGVIVRGVSDLWTYGMGTANLSEYFIQRVIQLKYKDTPQALGELAVTSVAGSAFGTTKITVKGQSENARFKIKMSPTTIALPVYDEDISDWESWDGLSEIVAEDGHQICVVEVTSENLARKAGTARIRINLG
jgi:hypothetical protein